MRVVFEDVFSNSDIIKFGAQPFIWILLLECDTLQHVHLFVVRWNGHY